MSDILKEENSHQDNLVQKWKPILEDTDLGPAITNIHETFYGRDVGKHIN